MAAAANGTTAELSTARASLRASWELAAVLNFLDVFRTQLAFTDELRAEALEDALLTAGCTPPLLHEVHLTLLQGMHPRSTFKSWRVTLADKLNNAWPDLAEGECPLPPNSVCDAEEAYDGLSGLDRVRALRALCELRLDTPGDLRDAIDDDETPDNFHGECLVGQDNRGARYFFQGLESGPRLYRERSRAGAAVKRQLVRYRRGADGQVTRTEEGFTETGSTLLDGWELVATTGEAIESLAAELRNDKFPGARNSKLCTQLDALADEVATRLKRDEARRARIERQRLEAAAANIQWEVGRSRRPRQEVSYTMEEYDKQFADVLRGGRGGADPAPYVENPFVRRGRSAAAFGDGPEHVALPDIRRPRSGRRESRSSDDGGDDDGDDYDDDDHSDPGSH